MKIKYAQSFEALLAFASRSFMALTFSGRPKSVMKPEASW
jgi:hypothetical protein